MKLEGKKFVQSLVSIQIKLNFNYKKILFRNYFLEALEAINPPLNSDQQKQADEILDRVKDRMRLQLMCFSVKEP